MRYSEKQPVGKGSGRNVETKPLLVKTILLEMPLFWTRMLRKRMLRNHHRSGDVSCAGFFLGCEESKAHGFLFCTAYLRYHIGFWIVRHADDILTYC